MKRMNLVSAITVLLAALAIALLPVKPANAQDATNTYTFLAAQTTTTTACSASRAVDAKQWRPVRTFFASGTTSAGAGAATITIYGSTTRGTQWTALGTITLTLATTTTFDTSTGGFVSNAIWPFLCAHVSAISGTGASVDVTGGVQ